MRRWEYSPAAKAVAFVLSLSVLNLVQPANALAQINVGPAGLSGGGTVTGPILFPDGTEAAPAMAFASQPGVGIWRVSSGIIAFNGVNQSASMVLSGADFIMRSTGSIGFSSGTNPEINPNDVLWVREAAAGFQMGLDATTAAVDQTLSAADAITNADISGGDLTIQSGSGMGTGAVSALIFQTPTVAAAGANAQSLATRLTVNSSGLLIGALTNATLGTPANGTVVYCSDCTIANPCAGSGTGAIAKRLNGVWVCN